MYIYIDEAGPFACCSPVRSSISCIGALVVPESVHKSFLNAFSRLRKGWGLSAGEIKGRNLSEEQFDQVIRVIMQFRGVFLRISAIDVGLHRKDVIQDHQKRQSERLRSPLDARFQKSFVDQVLGMADQIERMSPQLYVQSVLLTELVGSVIQTSTLLYSQLEPAALGACRSTPRKKCLARK